MRRGEREGVLIPQNYENMVHLGFNRVLLGRNVLQNATFFFYKRDAVNAFLNTIEQNSVGYLLSMHQTNMGQLTVVPS